MALLGRPKLGEKMRAQLRIKESKEFKVIKIQSINVIGIVPKLHNAKTRDKES